MATGSFLSGSASGIEVKARRRLSNNPEAVEALNAELGQTLAKAQRSQMRVCIADFDISQNQIPSEDFQGLLQTLMAASVKVQRFRLFGCPTLDDEAVSSLAEYLRAVTPELAPSEMHLSDCAITTAGFEVLMAAIEENSSFPAANAAGKFCPLYLRIENNYIEEAAIQSRVDQGIIIPFTKKKSMYTAYDSSDGKVHLLVHEDAKGFRQRSGDPPPPEQAPPPKPVWDRESQQRQQQMQVPAQHPAVWTRPAQMPMWPRSAQAPLTPAVRAPATHGAGWGKGGALQPRLGQPTLVAAVRPPLARPGGWTAQLRPQNPVAAQPQPQATWRARPMKGQENAGGALRPGNRSQVGGHQWQDRSRSPAAKEHSRPAPPNEPPPEERVPYPWQVHHSDEHNIPYFWNSETGESSWTNPAKQNEGNADA